MAPSTLSSASVFVDFDGTISTADVGVHLLDRLAGDAWLPIEELYDRQLIGSRECTLREWSLLPTTDEALLRAVAGEVALDPGFAPLAAGLRDAGAEVTVVSDGFGFYVQSFLSGVDVPVLTAGVDWRTGRLEFPFQDARCRCALCGTCKRTPVLDAASRGRVTIFVGDGNSDRHVAPLVDRLYAKDALARWCDGEGIAYRAFSSLGDVARDLGLGDTAGPPASGALSSP
jgi:2-hydroxy-3-keto-5-methylthiopentenyl-1-phosphate phosphatase